MSAVNSQITRPDAVDASCRLPVLKLVLGGLAWLIAGLALLLGASLVRQLPSLGGCEYFGFGKMAAAARVALTYGFAVQTGLGVGVWILFRSSSRPVPTGLAVAAGSVMWNIGVATGVVGIILGEASGIRGLDFPAYTGGILLAAYFLIGLAVLVGFGANFRGNLKLPQLLVLAALLWFPWLLTTAQVLVFWMPVRGILPTLVGSWYEQGLFWGVLTPLTLAALWHVRSEDGSLKLARPAFAVLGFWGLLLVAGWVGATALVGGPIPAWISSVGVVAGVLLIIPVVLIGFNLFGRISSPGGSLAILSGLSFVLTGTLTAMTSLRCANRILHFTVFPQALSELALLGFVGIGLLASLYVILPRLAGFAWPRAELILGHVALSGLGLALSFLPLLLGGWIQGNHLNLPQWSVNSVNGALLNCLRLQGLGLLVLLGAQLVFLGHWVLLCVRHFPAVKQFAIGLIQEEILKTQATVRSAK